MSKKIMENKKLFILVIFVLAGLFYWFQLRPSNIRKECNKYSYKQAGVEWKRENPYRSNENLVSRDDVDRFYEVCLRSKGLN